LTEDFPKILCRLRKERHLNQRTAAAALHISQALLSHYENGLREPGLSFVDAACRYYGVSSDYLLGRSPMRTSLVEVLERLPAACAPDIEELITLTVYGFLRPYDPEGASALSPAEARELCTAETAMARLRLHFHAQGAAPGMPEDLRKRAEAQLLARKRSLEEGPEPTAEGRSTP